MARLIDADELLLNNTWLWYDENGNHTIVGEAIENAPTVDAVPVVRCKECIHYWNGVCSAHTDAICTDENEFCSWGEKDEID